MLENLTPQGFVMAKSKIMDYPHLSLALRCLGEFHACSFITRSVNPTSFDKLRRMKEPLFYEQLVHSGYQANMIDVIMKALASEDKHYSERYQRFADDLTQHLVEATDGSAAEPYAVVNHGDFWTNNLLFKYDQKGNPYDLRFLDLQICRYASPVLDVLYVLFCCCTQETRRKYHDKLIHEYYDALSKRLVRADYDPNILFPYEVLSQHLAKFGKYAAGMATYTLSVFTSDDELQKAFDKDVLQERLQNDSFFRNMIIGTFKDIVDRNYI